MASYRCRWDVRSHGCDNDPSPYATPCRRCRPPRQHFCCAPAVVDPIELMILLINSISIQSKNESPPIEMRPIRVDIESVHHAQFAELGVIDRRWLHSAAWGRMRGGVGSGGSSPSSSAGFCISSGSDEPLDIPALLRARKPMPRAEFQLGHKESWSGKVRLSRGLGY